MARRQPKLMTLDEQRRVQNRSLDRGKKLLAGCLLGAAVILFNWMALPGIDSLVIAAVVLAVAVLAQLQQVKLRPTGRMLISAVAGIAGLYFAARGVLQIWLNASAG